MQVHIRSNVWNCKICDTRFSIQERSSDDTYPETLKNMYYAQP